MGMPEIPEITLEPTALSPELSPSAEPTAEVTPEVTPEITPEVTPETTAETAPEVSPGSTDFVMEGETAAADPAAAQETSAELVTEVTLEPTAAPTEEPKPSIGLPVLIAAVAAVVLLAVVAILIIRAARRRRADRDYEASARASTHVPRHGRNAAGMPSTEPVSDADLAGVSRYRVGYAQILGSRENQEDSYCISNWMDQQILATRGLLAAVADGIGGMDNGQVASGTVLRNMCARFDRQDPNMPLSDRLLELAAQGQQDVLRIVQKSGPCGTTLVSVMIKNGYMAMLSVGDSRISLYRSGMLLQLNREHVLGKESDENSMLNFTAQNTDARKRKAITAYLGKPNLRLIDRTTTPMKLVSGDRILLMSDGVFGPLSDDEIISAMHLPADKAAQAIVQAVADKRLPHQDNATIVIVEVE